MTKRLEVSLVHVEGGPGLRLQVGDIDLVGKNAKIRVWRLAEVTRSSGVDKSEDLHSGSAQLRMGVQDVALRLKRSDLFHYEGEKLNLRLKAEVEVDDGLIFDTEVTVDARRLCRLPERRRSKSPGKEVHSPKDRFRFWTNLAAIPPKARAIVLWLVAIGLPLIVVNALLGVHDQFVPEASAWFYDHSDSDGGGESPLFKALASSGALGFGLWMAIRHQLKKYMEFMVSWQRLPSLRRGARMRADELVEGTARVDLKQAVVRLVAFNREHGQYKDTERDGDKTRTVIRDFHHDAGGVVLYQQAVAFLAAGAPLSKVLAGEVDFDPIFEVLHPPLRISGSHGLSLCLEAQLLHPDFVDQDVELADVAVSVKDFFVTPLEPPQA